MNINLTFLIPHGWEKHSIDSALTLSQMINLDFSRLKEFADDNFKFDENGRKSTKWAENTGENETLLVASDFSFSHNVFKRPLLQ